MESWIWKHLLVPGISGFFFAVGQFIIYFLSRTQPALTFEAHLTGKAEKKT